MALWNRLKDELNRAGRAAQEALDEGKLRLDLLRSRQAMDKAAQKLGYAVYRARKLGGDIPADEHVLHAGAELERVTTPHDHVRHLARLERTVAVGNPEQASGSDRHRA